MWHHDRVLSSNIERIDSIPLQSKKSWSFTDNEILVGNSWADPSNSEFYTAGKKYGGKNFGGKVTLKLREEKRDRDEDDEDEDESGSEEKEESLGEKISMGKFNIYFYIGLIFVSDLSLGLLIPVLWFYCKYLEASLLFYGCLFSAYAGGGVIGMLLFYWLTSTFKFSQKKIFFLSLLIEFVGCLLFTFTPNKWILLGGIILIGISTAITELLPRLKLSLQIEKTLTSKIRNVHYFSLIIGTGAGILFSYIPETILFRSSYGQIILSGFNTIGYLLLLLTIIITILLFAIFRENTLEIEQDNLLIGGDVDDFIDKIIEPDDQESSSPRNDTKLSYFFLFSNWILYTCIYTLFVLVTPFTVNAYQWAIRDTSLYWCCVMVITMTGVIIISFFRHSPELLLFSIVGMIAAYGIMLDFTQPHVIFWRFVVGSGLVSVCFMIASELLYYLLQLLSVPYIFNYWIGSKYIAKITTPIWVMLLYENISEHWIFVIPMGLLVIVLVLFVYFFRITQRKLQELSIMKDGINILNN